MGGTVSKHRKTRQPGSDHAAGELGQPAPIWRDREVLLMDATYAHVLESGSHLRGLPCIICFEPIAGRPFIVHHLITQDLCSNGYPHLSGMAVLRHSGCAMLDDNDLVIRVSAVNKCTNFTLA